MHFSRRLRLNPGEYTVKIVPASGPPVTQTVKIEADKTVIVGRFCQRAAETVLRNGLKSVASSLRFF